MSSTSSKSADAWLELDCPRCKARFRIKSAYAHLSGRCPNCGKRIEAPRPVSPPAPVSFDSEEPLGLVPIEEEWPEPGQMDLDDRTHYGFGALPTQSAEPKPEKTPDVEAYNLEAGSSKRRQPMMDLFLEAYPDQPSEVAPPSTTPVPAQALDEAYLVDVPVSTPPSQPPPVSEEQKRAERVPAPPPLPPAWPLWRGVYTYPWKIENLKVWIALGLGLTLVIFLAAIFYQLVFVAKVLNQEGFHPEAAFAVFPIPVVAILGVIMALYGSAHFLAILEDSAGGNESYQRPEVVTDWFGAFFHLAFIGPCAWIPALSAGAVVATVYQSGWGWLVALPFALLLFPTFLLSSMAGTSRLAILDGNVISSFLRKPLLLPVLFLASSVLAAACLGLGYLTFTTSNFFIALATAFVWSACLIIYARLLGRGAWVMSQIGVNVKKRRKKRRKKPTPGPDDRGADNGGAGHARNDE